MAALSEQVRDAINKAYQAELSRLRDPLAVVTKADLKAAVDAIDNWVEANTVSFNTAIPQPARSNLTTKQKALMLVYVVDRRYEVL